jgi:hypothetical protein
MLTLISYFNGMCLFSCYYHNRVIRKSHPVFGPPFTPYPLFQWYPQSKKILLNLSLKFWNSAFNAQASRVIDVVVRARENICSRSGGAQEKGKTVYYQNYRFLSFNSPWMLMYYFAGFFWISPMYGQTQDSSAVFSLLAFPTYLLSMVLTNVVYLGRWRGR